MSLPESAMGIITLVVFICSILHSLLPPWDSFDGFPRFQPYYKVFIYIVGYVALNGRSTVHPSISAKNNGNGNGKDGK